MIKYCFHHRLRDNFALNLEDMISKHQRIPPDNTSSSDRQTSPRQVPSQVIRSLTQKDQVIVDGSEQHQHTEKNVSTEGKYFIVVVVVVVVVIFFNIDIIFMNIFLRCGHCCYCYYNYCCYYHAGGGDDVDIVVSMLNTFLSWNPHRLF